MQKSDHSPRVKFAKPRPLPPQSWWRQWGWRSLVLFFLAVLLVLLQIRTNQVNRLVNDAKAEETFRQRVIDVFLQNEERVLLAQTSAKIKSKDAADRFKEYWEVMKASRENARKNIASPPAMPSEKSKTEKFNGEKYHDVGAKDEKKAGTKESQFWDDFFNPEHEIYLLNRLLNLLIYAGMAVLLYGIVSETSIKRAKEIKETLGKSGGAGQTLLPGLTQVFGITALSTAAVASGTYVPTSHVSILQEIGLFSDVKMLDAIYANVTATLTLAQNVKDLKEGATNLGPDPVSPARPATVTVELGDATKQRLAETAEASLKAIDKNTSALKDTVNAHVAYTRTEQDRKIQVLEGKLANSAVEHEKRIRNATNDLALTMNHVDQVQLDLEKRRLLSRWTALTKGNPLIFQLAKYDDNVKIGKGHEALDKLEGLYANAHFIKRALWTVSNSEFANCLKGSMPLLGDTDTCIENAALTETNN